MRVIPDFASPKRMLGTGQELVRGVEIDLPDDIARSLIEDGLAKPGKNGTKPEKPAGKKKSPEEAG